MPTLLQLLIQLQLTTHILSKNKVKEGSPKVTIFSTTDLIFNNSSYLLLYDKLIVPKNIKFVKLGT